MHGNCIALAFKIFIFDPLSHFYQSVFVYWGDSVHYQLAYFVAFVLIVIFVLRLPREAYGDGGQGIC